MVSETPSLTVGARGGRYLFDRGVGRYTSIAIGRLYKSLDAHALDHLPLHI